MTATLTATAIRPSRSTSRRGIRRPPCTPRRDALAHTGARSRARRAALHDRQARALLGHRGRVRCRDPVAAGLWLFGSADCGRLGPGARRPGMGGADAPPRLHALSRAGRRRRRRRHGRDGDPGAGRARRHPSQLLEKAAARDRGARLGRAPVPELTESERAAFAAFGKQAREGCIAEQGQSPQTIGYALNDSPAGLAAWILDHDTDVPRATRSSTTSRSIADRYRHVGRADVLGGRPRGGRREGAAGR
jgi:hypothetical protein